MSEPKFESFSCPMPILNYDTVQLAHGAGGKLSAELIDKIFLPCFGNQTLDKLEDQAVLPKMDGRPVMTTDSFVVSPIFFPGGDIGDLAVNGTVNDICMSGAKPLYITTAFIIEEGLPIEDLHKIVVSMKRAADKSGVIIVAGDTKVVNKGSCDKIFINTTGAGYYIDTIESESHWIVYGGPFQQGVCNQQISESGTYTMEQNILNCDVNYIMNIIISLFRTILNGLLILLSSCPLAPVILIMHIQKAMKLFLMAMQTIWSSIALVIVILQKI